MKNDKFDITNLKKCIISLKESIEAYKEHDVWGECDIHSIDEVKKNQKKILDFIYESKDMNATTKKVLSDFIFMVIKCIANTKKEEWKTSLSNMFKVNLWN